MAAFVSTAAPPKPLLPLRRSNALRTPPGASSLSLSRRNLACCCSVPSPASSVSSSTSTSVSEGEGSSPTAAATGNSGVCSLSGCKGCGREQIESGCNGEGRIQGGIATIPGFGWWPIKAYRPCPGFLASGGRYKRQGQSMDEVISGGGKR